MTSLLSRSPQVASRLIALDLLDRAGRAAARLEDPEDDTALHDFRVALRRLRSICRAYRGPLQDSLRKRDRRRLAEISRATSPSRDAEVALAWVAAQGEELSDGERPGLGWLIRRIEHRRGESYEDLRRRVREDFVPLAAELEERLGVYTRRLRLAGGDTARHFGELVGSETQRECARIEHLLREIGDAGDTDGVHQVRLAAKRLRYLLEPLSGEMAAVRPILARLRSFQDLLGELNDAYVLERELTAAVEVAARQGARDRLREAVEGNGGGADGDGPEADTAATPGEGPLEGLLALAQVNRRRRDRLFGELAAGWLVVDGGDEAVEAGSPDLAALTMAVGELARWLDAGFSPPPPESAEASPALAS